VDYQAILIVLGCTRVFLGRDAICDGLQK
jgi:hypothetical protein